MHCQSIKAMPWCTAGCLSHSIVPHDIVSINEVQTSLLGRHSPVDRSSPSILRPGFESQAQHQCFFSLNCSVKMTKTSKKRPGIGPPKNNSLSFDRHLCDQLIFLHKRLLIIEHYDRSPSPSHSRQDDMSFYKLSLLWCNDARWNDVSRNVVAFFFWGVLFIWVKRFNGQKRTLSLFAQNRQHPSPTVWPDWAILYHLGNFLKPVATFLAQNVVPFLKRCKNLQFSLWKLPCHFRQLLTDIGRLFA